ncbi:iron donor protein CyaY [Opisthorchis viverrini]|uniref:ferroxidase n=1 Tax=Opisthorchis viverrini TaxID=6198 RepID=A0A1S8WWG6_OPIVI|nr:iron donor protein CyaY [Opisthorchis viverrini]
MELSNSEYESLSNETLDKLAEVFDSLGEKYNLDKDYDVEHAYGVLKVYFGAGIGTYIINRQAPNKQLWLSSPRSGPKRYDFIRSRDEWWAVEVDKKIPDLDVISFKLCFNKKNQFSQSNETIKSGNLDFLSDPERNLHARQAFFTLNRTKSSPSAFASSVTSSV